MPQPNFYYVGDCGPRYFTECKIAYWLWRIFPFILLVIGTFGNVLNIIVLSTRQMRKYSTTTFLLILAVTELTVLWTSLVPATVLSIIGIRLVDLSPVTCRLRWWLALTSGSFSTWILVLLTLERTLLTKAPIFSKRKLTPRNALIVSLAVLSVIAVLNSHMIFGLRFYDIPENDNPGQNVTAPQPPFKCHFSSVEYGKFYTQYWNIIVLTVYNLVPAAIIIIGNINIAVVLVCQRKNLARVNPTTHPGNNARRKSSAKMLFILSVFYILSTTPWCIYYLFRGQLNDLSEESFAKWQLATAAVNILVWCNFSFNFFFYFVSGTLFKSEWRRLTNKVKSRFQNMWTPTSRTGS